MYYQAGRIGFGVVDQNIVHFGRLSKFSFSRKNEKVEAVGFPLDVNTIQTLDSAPMKSTWTLKVSQESIDKLDIQFMLDQFEFEAASIRLPMDQTKVTVPSGSPYDVTVTGLAADQEVACTVISDTSPKYLAQLIGAGTLAAGQHKVAADKITFHPSEAGKTILVMAMQTKTAIKVIGGNADPRSYGVVSFKGIIKGTRGKNHLYFPRCSYTGDFEIGFGDKTEVGMEFDILTPADWSFPYAIWDAEDTAGVAGDRVGIVPAV